MVWNWWSVFPHLSLSSYNWKECIRHVLSPSSKASAVHNTWTPERSEYWPKPENFRTSLLVFEVWNEVHISHVKIRILSHLLKKCSEFCQNPGRRLPKQQGKVASHTGLHIFPVPHRHCSYPQVLKLVRSKTHGTWNALEFPLFNLPNWDSCSSSKVTL